MFAVRLLVGMRAEMRTAGTILLNWTCALYDVMERGASLGQDSLVSLFVAPG